MAICYGVSFKCTCGCLVEPKVELRYVHSTTKLMYNVICCLLSLALCQLAGLFDWEDLLVSGHVPFSIWKYARSTILTGKLMKLVGKIFVACRKSETLQVNYIVVLTNDLIKTHVYIATWSDMIVWLQGRCRQMIMANLLTKSIVKNGY